MNHILIIENPDIICLQEVIPYTWEIIKNKLFPIYYSAFENPYINNTSARIHGEVILSKIKLNNTSFRCLPSFQGRVNTWGHFENFSIGTGHLESYITSNNIIKKQINNINFPENPWIWIGDTNINNDEEDDFLKYGLSK